MLGDLGVGELTANRTQRRERAFFILAHQPRIAGDIEAQNGRQPALDPRFAHLVRQSTGRSAAEDMMDLNLTRAPLRRGSEAEPNDGSPSNRKSRTGRGVAAWTAQAEVRKSGTTGTITAMDDDYRITAVARGSPAIVPGWCGRIRGLYDISC